MLKLVLEKWYKSIINSIYIYVNTLILLFIDLKKKKIEFVY